MPSSISSKSPWLKPVTRAPCSSRTVTDTVTSCTSTRMAGCAKQTAIRTYSVDMDLKVIELIVPQDGNVILGHSHFIKTVEDLYEAIVNTVPHMKFGIAFNEASGACLIRVDGNDPELEANATENAQAVAAGHTFFIAMRQGYPINVLKRIRE